MIIALILLALLLPKTTFSLTLEDGLKQWSPVMPLETGDSRILLDATLTSSSAATAVGFTLAGAGHTFDADGFTAAGDTGYLLMSNWASSSAVAQAGTVYLECGRNAFSWSYANNGASSFSASEGLDGGVARYLFRAYNDGFTEEIRFFVENGSDDLPRFMYETGSQSTTTTLGRMNSYAPSTSPTTQSVVITWSGLDYWLYVDGHLIMHKVNSAVADALRFDNFRVGELLGTAKVKRIQISSAFIAPRMLNRKVAAYGDSFIAASIDATAAAGDTVAQIDAIQTHTGLPERLANYIKARGQANWGHWLQALAYRDLRVAFPFYVSAKNGTGYSIVPRASAYTSAVNTFQPEVVIAMQSVNDVNPAAPVSDIVEKTKAEMDTLIDGNPKLRKILFVTGISGHQDPAKVATNGWVQEYERLTGLLNTGLDNYRGKVQVIQAYSAWGGRNYPTTQTIGSHPLNTTPSAGNDVHPTEVGHIRIAEIVWPYLKPYLDGRLPRQ